MSPGMQSHVGLYAASHAHRINRVLHFAGIPLIAVALLGLLGAVEFAAVAGVPLRPSLAWPVLVAAAGWYLWQDLAAGAVVSAALVGCYLGGLLLPVWALVILFSAGVVAHGVGHYGFEGKPPALFSRPVAVLEAPAWLLAVATHAERH